MVKSRSRGELAFPLAWPLGHARRSPHKRTAANFKVSFGTARDHLVNELKLLGARYIVISTNVPTRYDGLPYARSPRSREPDDPGVAVYFDFDGEHTVFACDKWKRVSHNLRAIGKTIEAIRGIARWGSSDMMKRAVSAFKALPPDSSEWRAVFGFSTAGHAPSLDDVKVVYRRMAADAHPDRGGNPHEMVRLNKAWEAAQKELA